MTPPLNNDCCSSENEPIEVKLIQAVSDGIVNVTPEKCERIRKLLSSEKEKWNGEVEGILKECSDLWPPEEIVRPEKDLNLLKAVLLLGREKTDTLLERIKAPYDTSKHSIPE